VTENYKTLKIKSNKYKRIIIKDSLWGKNNGISKSKERTRRR
jgi:hypothetical protein